MNVAATYRAAGQHDRAIAELRRGLEVTPGALVPAWPDLRDDGHFDEAIREFEARVTVDAGP